MKNIRIHPLILPAFFLCIFAWIVYGFYTGWEAKKFEKELQRNAVPSAGAGSEKRRTISEGTWQKQTAPTLEKGSESGTFAPGAHPLPTGDAAGGETRTATSLPHSHDPTSKHSHEHKDTSAVKPEDIDSYILQKSTEYHEYLTSDPERAYQRLREAFIYRYGEHTEIDTFISFVRKANAGPLTVDEVISLHKTESRLRGHSEVISQQIADLEMLKANALRNGVKPHEMLIHYKFNFIGGRP